MSNAADIIYTTDFPASGYATQGIAGTTASVPYTPTLAGTTPPSLVFTAPTSGNVWVAHAAEISNSGANYSFCSWQIRQGNVVGSGAIFGGGPDLGFFHNGTLHTRQGVARIVPGLTPGTVYNIQMMFHVDAGTGTFQNMDLSVTPAP